MEATEKPENPENRNTERSLLRAVYETDLRLTRAEARLDLASRLVARCIIQARQQDDPEKSAIWAEAAVTAARMIDVCADPAAESDDA